LHLTAVYLLSHTHTYTHLTLFCFCYVRSKLGGSMCLSHTHRHTHTHTHTQNTLTTFLLSKVSDIAVLLFLRLNESLFSIIFPKRNKPPFGPKTCNVAIFI